MIEAHPPFLVVCQEDIVAKELRCRDLGIDCEVVIRGETQEIVVEKAAGHIQAAHGLPTDSHMLDQLIALIRGS